MKPKIIDAYAEWDDPHAFRVYLVRELPDDDSEPEEAQPMESTFRTGREDTEEARLYRAAFVACWKDLGSNTERILGFESKAAAERVAKAVKAELARIEKGQPGPTDDDVALAAMLAKGRRQ